jgi:hypothetical protein
VTGSEVWLNEGKVSRQYVFHDCLRLVYSMLIFINTTLYNCSCECCIFILCRVFIVCVVLCTVSLDRYVILGDVCCLGAVSYCSTTATG